MVTTTSAFSARIDLFADQAMTQCSLVDNGQFTPVYVFWSGPEQASAVYFSAPLPACWTGASWVGDGMPGYRAWIGNSQTALYVTLFAPGIAECKTQALICTIYFVTSGGAQPCCDMKVLPVQNTYELYPLEYFDCFSSTYPASAGTKITINPNASCQCGGPLATEPTSWGRVKSLYR